MIKKLLFLNLLFISCNMVSAETKVQAEKKYLGISPENSTLLKDILTNVGLHIPGLQSEVLKYLTKYVSVKSFEIDRFGLPDICSYTNDNLIISCFTNDIQIWDTDGNCLKVCRGHTDVVTCLCILPNKQFASGSIDKTIKIWDTTTGNCLKTIESGHRNPRCLCFLGNNKLASAEHREIKIWDLDSTECLNIPIGALTPLSLSLMQDNKIILQCFGGTIKIFDIDSGECLQTIKEDVVAGNLCVLSDNRIATACRDIIKIWDSNLHQCESILENNSNFINSLCLLPNGLLACASIDGTIRIWDGNSQKCVEVLNAYPMNTNFFCKISDGKLISCNYKANVQKKPSTLIKVWEAFDLTI